MKESVLYDLCDLRRLVLDLRHFEQTLKDTTALSLNEALCLCQTGKGKGDPGSLSEELELSPSRLSRILDSLERRGLLIRTMSPDDRRAVSIHLTEAGAQLVATLRCTDIAIPHHLEEAIEILHANSVQPGETI